MNDRNDPCAPSLADAAASSPKLEILAELERVLQFQELAASRQMSRFLQFVVEESLAGHEADLKERTIALEAFDRPTDFDPRLDPIVRIVAGKLRRALTRGYARDPGERGLRIDIPRGGYRPTFDFAGRRIGSTIETAASTTKPGPSIARATSAVETRSPSRPILAVLPFLRFDDDPRAVRLASTLPQDLAIRLANQPNLAVIDYAVTNGMQTATPDPRRLAADLQAVGLLLGSVRCSGPQFRVTAQLTDGATGIQLWAGRFESRFAEPTTESFADESVTDEIVARILADLDDVAIRLARLNAAQPSASDRAGSRRLADPSR